jgi:Spy/CpxP family protein refolding chaperone
MKKSMVCTLGLLLALTGVGFAQQIPGRPDGPPPPPHHARKGGPGHMPMKELNLSDAQKESFKKQRSEFKQRMDALKKEENITVKEWKSRMENLRKENQSAMQNILTPEQKEKMKSMRGKAGEMQMQGMKERLNLTDDQAVQLKKQQSATQKQMQAIRENASLSTEQKREASKKLMKEQKESMEKLLTEEQKKKFKEMRSNGPKGPMHRRGTQPPPPPSSEEDRKRPKQKI